MNAWRDFNDAPGLPWEENGTVGINHGALATFLDVVFGYCDGLIPVRGFVDVGQGHTTRPHNIWINADATAPDLLATYAAWAAKEGSAVYVIPGTVAAHGEARAEHVQQMQTALVDLDNGVALTIAAIQAHFPTEPPDIICIDPIRNLFDGGPDGDGENDNTAMLFFLQSRVEAVREAVAPDAGLILCHHTKKVAKKALTEDPFMALSGASALRSFYTSGIIMYRPEEDQPERRLEIELRNGPALDAMIIDKRNGRWIELDARGERLVRQHLGSRLDAERTRRQDLILDIIANEALAGRVFTGGAFAAQFENTHGLGGEDTISRRINVLANKGYIKFLRAAPDLGIAPSRSSKGYLVVQDMLFASDQEEVDPDTGEVTRQQVRLLPTHFQSETNHAVLPVENPEVWVLTDPDLDGGAA